MASPPFNPAETVPQDTDLAANFPSAERTFRDVVESWIITEHGRSGHHTLPKLTTSARDAITDWEVGSLIYNSTLSKMQFVTSIGPVVWVDVIEFIAPVQGTTTTAGVFEKATDSEVYAATADKALTADLIETAAAGTTLTDAGTVAVDWDAGLNFDLTISANRVLGNPTNGQPRTFRTIVVQGNDATDRTLTFGNQYLGAVPTLTDIDSTKWYLLTIFCVTTSHFVVSAKQAK